MQVRGLGKNGSGGLYDCMMNKDDIDRLFRSNYKAMLVLANRMVHDKDTARDLVHDVFASLLTADVPATTPAYLLSGVRFACLKHIRSLSVRQRFTGLYALDSMDTEDEQWPDEEDIARIREIIERDLPGQTREIVRLRFCGRLTYNEIAIETGLSQVSVYKHLRHAIFAIREG